MIVNAFALSKQAKDDLILVIVAIMFFSENLGCIFALFLISCK